MDSIYITVESGNSLYSQMRKDYGNSIIIRDCQKSKLGILVVFDERQYRYRIDFFSEKKKTFFLLKYEHLFEYKSGNKLSAAKAPYSKIYPSI